MKRTLATAALTALIVTSFAEVQAQQASEPTGQKTLAAVVGLYVFPAEGQSTEQQSKDEAECYNWAVDNTKTDPFSLSKQAQQAEQAAAQQQAQIQQSGEGAGVKGAVAGAAADIAAGGLSGVAETAGGVVEGAGEVAGSVFETIAEIIAGLF